MISYSIKERPRCTGKTIELKLRVLEDFFSGEADFDRQIIITPNQNMMTHFYRWKDSFMVDTSAIVVCSTETALQDALRGIEGKRIAVYIEEPFMNAYHKQTAIIDTLDECGRRNNVFVFGIGTQEPEEYVNQIFKNKMES